MDLQMFGAAAALGLAALGSALGTGIASQAAIGGWKKCFQNDKPAPFMLVAFAGVALTQTIYGFLLMNFILGSSSDNGLGLLGAGIFGGMAMG
ncbi:MAG: V-type ATP synthase subunit K, partial [Candidatus Marinimicrobia bacterium]|nr:V-type ATP synthase subunit K [Candidatus Neomarinimicrobiota bacterium]